MDVNASSIHTQEVQERQEKRDQARAERQAAAGGEGEGAARRDTDEESAYSSSVAATAAAAVAVAGAGAKAKKPLGCNTCILTFPDTVRDVYCAIYFFGSVRYIFLGFRFRFCFSFFFLILSFFSCSSILIFSSILFFFSFFVHLFPVGLPCVFFVETFFFFPSLFVLSCLVLLYFQVFRSCCHLSNLRLRRCLRSLFLSTSTMLEQYVPPSVSVYVLFLYICIVSICSTFPYAVLPVSSTSERREREFFIYYAAPKNTGTPLELVAYAGSSIRPPTEINIAVSR